MKCLIVDDDPRSREMTRRVLADRGYEFIEAADGGEALALYREQGPEVVIMDVEMKPVDGLSATKSICAENGACQVVIMSNYGTEEIRKAALQAGASHFVRKEALVSLPGILTEIEASLSPPQPNEP